MGRDAEHARAPTSTSTRGCRSSPALAIMIVVLGFNFLGDGLRDILDPRLGPHVGDVAVTPTSRPRVLDVLIKDGWVADGAGSPPFLGDVAIEGGRIVEVGRLGDAATADRVIDATGKIVCPGFVDPHSHSDFSLLANPTAREHDPPGRHDRGRRQLRLELRAGHRRTRASHHERPAAHVRLRRADRSPGRRSASTSTSSRTSGTARTSPGSSATTRSGSPRASPGRTPTDEQIGAMDGLRARGDGGRRARHVDRARVQPRARGDRRRADAAERRSPASTTASTRATSATATPASCTRSPSSSRSRAPGGIRGRDLAPQRPPQHERARPGLGARGRDDGRGARGGAWTCSPTRRRSSTGLGQLAGILPPWVAAGRHGGGRSATCATRRPGSGCGPSATATGASSTRASGSACACRRASSIPSWDGLTFAQIAEPRARRIPWDCYFDVLADAGDAYETILVVGRLFTDEHMAGDDLAPALLPRRRHVHGHARGAARATSSATRSATPATSTTSPTTCGRTGHPAPRGGDPQDDEHARRAFRPLGPRPAPRRLQPPTSSCFDYDGLDDVSTVDDPHHYARGVEHVLVNGVVVVDDGEHTGARRGGTSCGSGTMIDLRSDVCSRRRRTRCGRRCGGRARLGDGRRGRLRSTSSAEARRGAARQAQPALWVPTCGMANLVALLTFCARGRARRARSRPRTSSPRRRWGSTEIARLAAVRRSGPRTGGMDPTEVGGGDRRDRVRCCSSSRTRTRGPEARRRLAGADGRRWPRRHSCTAAYVTSRRRAARQRGGRARCPAVQDLAAPRSNSVGGLAEQGRSRAVGRGARRQ